MKAEIVKLQIVDYDANGEIMLEYDLINPDRKKLAELKHMIEGRYDYQFDDNLTDAEMEKAEQFRDNIWEEIEKFIADNFVVLTINEVYEIAY